MTTQPKPIRYPEGHPLAWPKPPKRWSAFTLNLYQPRTPEGAKRPASYSRRLRELSNAELAWVARTVAIEIQRRGEREGRS